MDSVALNYRTASELNSAVGRVFGYMFQALLMSVLATFAVASVPALTTFLFSGWMMYVTVLLPLPAIFLLGFFLNTDPPRGAAHLALLGFGVIMGISLTAILARDPLLSLQAFIGAASLFAVMAGWGYFTKQSLDGWGKYLFAAVIALIIVSVINVFLGSGLLGMLISAVAILVFSLLTAYDMQNIRESLSSGDSTAAQEIYGALSLYMNLINIWISLINLLSGERE